MYYFKKNPNLIYILGALVIVIIQIVTLHSFGQTFVCQCGEIKFWEGVVFSPGNSQQFTDWYTFSHIIHGFLFYLLFWLIFPKSKVGTRLLMAMLLEVSWEIAENTPAVIQAYRSQALAVGYNGDSILNSVCDNLSMMFGFLLANRTRVILIVLLGLTLELFAGYFIHDTLTLNILNFIHPINFITAWQSSIH
jgi:hypothetical protein